jgi:4-diphosphocytidyl-2C-methyl-D-erythritol kinase
MMSEFKSPPSRLARLFRAGRDNWKEKDERKTEKSEPCNIKKGTQDIQQFLTKKPNVLKRILVQAKRPLKDAAAVNSTRWALFKVFKSRLRRFSSQRYWRSLPQA